MSCTRTTPKGIKMEIWTTVPSNLTVAATLEKKGKIAAASFVQEEESKVRRRLNCKERNKKKLQMIPVSSCPRGAQMMIRCPVMNKMTNHLTSNAKNDDPKDVKPNLSLITSAKEKVGEIQSLDAVQI